MSCIGVEWACERAEEKKNVEFRALVPLFFFVVVVVDSFLLIDADHG